MHVIIFLYSCALVLFNQSSPPSCNNINYLMMSSTQGRVNLSITLDHRNSKPHPSNDPINSRPIFVLVRSFIWIYIRKGKKRLSIWCQIQAQEFGHQAFVDLWSSSCLSGLFSFHAWMFNTLNLSTQNKPYAFSSSFIPDVLPKDVALCVCAYLGCHSHMFELQLFDFLLHSLQFLPALVLILRVSAAESAFHSVSLFQDVSRSISCPQRDGREHALWQRVCVLVFVCVWMLFQICVCSHSVCVMCPAGPTAVVCK